MALKTVLKNICTFIEILNTSTSPSVSNWNEQSFCNAFQWAAYCEQIYIQSEEKAYRHDLDREIQKLDQLFRIETSVPEVNLNMLKHASHLLVTNFLRNVHLKSDMLSFLLSGSLSAQVNCYFVEECGRLVRWNAVHLLLSVVDKNMNAEDLSHSVTESSTDDQMVMSSDALMAATKAGRFPDVGLSEYMPEMFGSLGVRCVSRLLLNYLTVAVRDDGQSGTERLKLKLMATFGQTSLGKCVLVTSYSNLVNSLPDSSVRKFLEKCLLAIMDDDRRFIFAIPLRYLVPVCNSSLEFYRAYIRHLVKCCDNMKPAHDDTVTMSHVGDICRLISWRPTVMDSSQMEPALDFYQLVDCFSSLLCSGNSSVVSATERLLLHFVKCHGESSVWNAIVNNIGRDLV